MEIAMIQDQIVEMANLEPAYMDRGTYFGDGVYEVVRSYDGRVFALDEHLERLAGSLKAIGITAVDINKIRRRVKRAYKAASIDNAKIYFHITRGRGPRSHLGGKGLKPNFFLTVTELGDQSQLKNKPIAVSTHPDLRWKRCDIKSLNLLPNVLARMDAAKKGCDEAIFVDEKGDITEGAASAFFLILAQEKKLVTRGLGPEILPSITRKIVLQIAGNAGLTVLEKAITPWQATWADELFIAVTTKDIVPVVKFDGEKIGDGKVGKYTKLLTKEFKKEVKKRRWP